MNIKHDIWTTEEKIRDKTCKIQKSAESRDRRETALSPSLPQTADEQVAMRMI